MNEKDNLKMTEKLISYKMEQLSGGMKTIEQTEYQKNLIQEHYSELFGARRLVRALLSGKRPVNVFDEMESEYNSLMMQSMRRQQVFPLPNRPADVTGGHEVKP